MCGLYHQLELFLRVIRALYLVIEWRGKPKEIRCEDGAEYISHALAAWAQKHDISLMFIQPSNSQQNAYVERYDRTFRYDWLNQRMFMGIDQAQISATQSLWNYNNERTIMALAA